MPEKMTRKKTGAFLRQRGFPIGDGTLDKLCMPSCADGPPVAAWWGRRPLYDPADVLAWAEKRLRPAQKCVALPRNLTDQINSSTCPALDQDGPDAT